MEETGIVLRETNSSHALVRLERSEACHSCGMCDMSGEHNALEARNEAGAAPGDTVTIHIQDGLTLRAAVLVFLLPLIGLLAGIGASRGLAALGGWPANDLRTVLFGLAGLALCTLPALLANRAVTRTGQPVARITRIIANR